MTTTSTVETRMLSGRHEVDFDIPHPHEVFVGGEWVAPAVDAVIEVIDPTTEAVVGSYARPGFAEADAAVAAARQAYDHGPWPHLPVADRIAVVRRFTEGLEKRMPELNKSWTLEVGATTRHAEIINGTAGVMAWNLALDVAPTLPWEENRGEAIIRREASGTVLAVLTSNGATSIVGMKVVPALLAGCPVIVKHAPENQLSAHLIAEAALEADFPPGVVSVLPADTEITQYLVGSDGVDVVGVTGSQAIAIDIIQRTAPRLARTVLELGGKSPAILAEDVDLPAILPGLAEGAQAFNGQVCVALSRILVPRSRYEETVAAFKEYFENDVVVGDPLDPASTRGPLSVARALTRVEGYVAGALAQGARLVTGGKRPEHLGTGYYYEPTLLADVTNDMTVAQEEVFGPVTVLIAYDDIEEAIAIANDTEYGLAASIFTADLDVALDIARRIRSGTVGVNVAGMSLGQPFGGVKKSGWGRECGPEGILEFTDIKQMLLPSGRSYLD